MIKVENATITTDKTIIVRRGDVYSHCIVHSTADPAFLVRKSAGDKWKIEYCVIMGDFRPR